MSVKRDTAYNGILQILNVIFPLITAPYTSRVLGVDGIGLTAFVIGYVSYYMIFAMLSAPFYGIREIAQQNNKEGRSKAFSTIFFLTVIAMIVCMIFYLSSIFLVDKLYDNRTFLLASSIQLLLAPLNIDWYYLGTQNVRYITLRSIIIKVLGILSIFVFVRDQNDVMAYLMITVLSTAGAGVWAFVKAITSEVKLVFENLDLKKTFVAMMPLFVGGLAVSIYTLLDALMLGFLSTDAEVGYYTQPFRISRIFLFLALAASPIIVVKIASHLAHKRFAQIRSLLARSFDLTMFITTPLTVGMIVVAPRFVPFFFGEEFAPSILPMQLLSGLVFVVGCAYVFKVQVIGSFKKDKLMLWISILTAVLNFLANLLLIPKYGAVGAALASIVAEAVSLVIGIWYSQKIVKIKFSIKNIAHPILLSTCFFFISMLFHWIFVSDVGYLIFTVGGCALFYAAAMLMLKNESAIYAYRLIEERWRWAIGKFKRS